MVNIFGFPNNQLKVCCFPKGRFYLQISLSEHQPQSLIGENIVDSAVLLTSEFLRLHNRADFNFSQDVIGNLVFRRRHREAGQGPPSSAPASTHLTGQRCFPVTRPWRGVDLGGGLSRTREANSLISNEGDGRWECGGMEICRREGEKGMGIGNWARAEQREKEGRAERPQPKLASSSHRARQARGSSLTVKWWFNQLCSSVEDRFNIRAHFQSH